MAKYKYFDGERRYHHRVIIWYSATPHKLIGYTEPCHWYIRLCTTLADSPSGRRVEIEEVYFPTLTKAKEFIDNFGQ